MFMFLASRIVNGLMATLCLLTTIMLGLAIVEGFLVSLSLKMAAVTVIPVVLFICDLVFRGQDSSKNSILFTGCWMVWYLYFVLKLIPPDLAYSMDPTSLPKGLLWTSTILFVLPFLVNGVHLLQQVTRKKTCNN